MEHVLVKQPNISKDFPIVLRDTLLFFLGIVLPGVSLLLPLIVLYIYNRHERQTGHKIVSTGFLFSILIMAYLHSWLLLVGTFPLFLAGYMLATASYQLENPFVTLGKSFAVVVLSVGLFTGVYALYFHVSVYSDTVQAFQTSINEMIQHYHVSSADSPETEEIVITTLQQVRQLIPQILPSMILVPVLGSLWLSMIIGNLLLEKNCSKQLWPSLATWRIPDQCIWIGIISGLMLVIPLSVHLQLLALNTLIVSCLFYAFQGYSICTFFMKKWNVSIFVKIVFYAVLLFQSFALVLLSVLGIADIWADFRKLTLPPAQSTQFDGI